MENMIKLLQNENQPVSEPLWVRKFLGSRSICKHIIALNSLVYVLVFLLQGEHELWRFGTLHRTLVFEEGQYYRFITAYFLHNTDFFLHIVLNMLVLLWIGSFVEFMYGRINFFYIYMFSGLASTLASYTITHTYPWDSNPETVGASGAIFGLIGATVAFLKKYKNYLKPELGRSLLYNMYLIIGLNICVDVLINQMNQKVYVDTSAHLSGLIVGILLGLDAKPLILGYRHGRGVVVLACIMFVCMVAAFVNGYFVYMETSGQSSWIWNLGFFKAQ